MVGPTAWSRGAATGAAMNAIVNFSTALASELQQLKCEVECHRHAIHVEAEAFEKSRTEWVTHDSDVTRRMKAMRQRLAR